MSHSVNGFDSGELATVQATWGIAHPTGYPFFAILGFIFSKIPLPFSTIFKLNLLCVLWNSLTIFFLIKTVKYILENIEYFVINNDNNKLKWLNIDKRFILIISILSSLSFAFSVTFWEQASRIEVYSLQLFLTSVIIFFSIKEFTTIKKDQVKIFSKNLLIIAIFLGLAFSNHLMTIYLIPALLYLFFNYKGINKKSLILFFELSLIIVSIAVFFYLLMMFRAQMSPPYIFSNPSSISKLISHVQAEEYRDFMFKGLGTVKKQSIKLLKMLSFDSNKNFISGEFSFMLIFVFSGIIFSSIFFKKLFIWSILLISTCLFFAFNYSIPDINEYYLVVFLCFAIMISISLIILFSFLKNKINKIILLVVAFVFVISQLFTNYNLSNKRNDFFAEDYTKSLLNSLPKGSFLISQDWTFLISPSLYLQNVGAYRKDVKIISTYWMQKDWYKKDLAKKYGSLREIQKKDYYVTFDVVKNLIDKNKFNLGAHNFIVPDVFTFKIVHNQIYYPAEDPDFKIHFSEDRNKYEEFYYSLIAWMLENRAKYELSFNKVGRAKLYIKKILTDFPDYKITPDLIDLVKNKKL